MFFIRNNREKSFLLTLSALSIFAISASLCPIYGMQKIQPEEKTHNHKIHTKKNEPASKDQKSPRKTKSIFDFLLKNPDKIVCE
ncbi:MAG: hypothetical protein ACTSXG_03955 [Alphaproteobacteria bacterium]